VLSEGKLYWIQDAYTTSNRYPYATPERTWTYQTQFQQNVDGGFSNGSSSQEPRGTESHSLASFDGLNYIRNSVKVVVDMYDGSVRFFVMDPKDRSWLPIGKRFPMCSASSAISPPISKSTCAILKISSRSKPTSTEPSHDGPAGVLQPRDFVGGSKENNAGEVQSMELITSWRSFPAAISSNTCS